jgi:hypothetical protein
LPIFNYDLLILTSLRTLSREPHILDESRPRPEVIGISGGLFSAAVISISINFETLYAACIEAGRVWSRLCNLTLVRSRAMEESPGTWGWAILGIPAADLGKTLDQFQSSMVSSIYSNEITLETNQCSRRAFILPREQRLESSEIDGVPS